MVRKLMQIKLLEGMERNRSGEGPLNYPPEKSMIFTKKTHEGILLVTRPVVALASWLFEFIEDMFEDEVEEEEVVDSSPPVAAPKLF